MMAALDIRIQQRLAEAQRRASSLQWCVEVKCQNISILRDDNVNRAAHKFLLNNIGNIMASTQVASVQIQEACTVICVRCQSHKLAKSVLAAIYRLKEKLHVTAKLQIAQRSDLEQLRSKALAKMTDLSSVALKKHQAKVDEEERFIDLNCRADLRQHARIQQFMQIHKEKYTEVVSQKIEYEKYYDMLRRKVEVAASQKVAEEQVHFLEVETMKLKSALPIYAKKTEIIEMTLKHNAFVLLGETGSGKSTQTPQYLCQTDLCERGLIACVQPRQVAAVSLAQQVAKEMKSHVGGVVGYRAGFQVRQTAATKVMYMTNHAILKECIQDPLLTKYSCVIVDEAHERSIYCDLLLGMIKAAMQHRHDLKVIIMSATIDPALFVQYFQNCPVLEVSGRTFPVDVLYKSQDTKYDETRYLEEAVDKAVDVHYTEASGDILVFLTSPVEIERAIEMFKGLVNDVKVQCLPLHGRLQPQEQQKVFAVTPHGQRKVVFATNCAETSITLPGIKYVIDTGKAKEMRFDSKKGISTLDVQWISRSSADQRKGRAGRTSEGKCFRLYFEADYQSMATGTTPDLLKSHLGMAFLTLMDLGIQDPLKFDYVQAPPKESMESAMKELRNLGALNDTGLSELGKKLAKLSIEPKYGKLLLEAVEEDMGFDAMVFIALLTVGANIFFRMGTNEEKQKADRLKTQFCHLKGDIFTMYNVYKVWNNEDEKKKSQWCVGNSINAKSMRMCRDVVNDLRTTLKKELGIAIKFDFCQAEDFEEKLTRLLLRSYSKNISKFTGHSSVGYFVASLGSAVVLHPSAALNMLNQEPEWVLYTSILATNRQYLLNATSVDEQLIVSEIGADAVLAISLEMEEKDCIVKPHEVCRAGATVLKTLIGPKGSNINKLKTKLQEECFGDAPHVVDISVTSGSVTLTCPSALSNDGMAYVRSQVERIKGELRGQTREEKLHKDTDIRYVLEKGAVLQTVLMREDYRTIIVQECPPHVSEDKVEEVFKSYGICRVFPSDGQQRRQSFWGKVEYRNEKDAKAAMKAYQDKTDVALSLLKLRVETIPIQDKSGLTTKMTVSWIRRPCTGLGFLKFNTVEDAVTGYTNLQAVDIPPLSIKLSRKSNTELVIYNVPENATNESIQKIIGEALSQGVFNRKDPPHYELVLIRAKSRPSTEEEVDSFKEELVERIRNESLETNFQLSLPKPKDQAITWFGYVNTDQATAEKIYNVCNKNIYINCKHVTFKLQLTAEILLNRMFSKLRPHYEETVKYIDMTFTGVRLRVQRDRRNREVLSLETPDVDTFSEVNMILQKLLYGVVCEANDEFDLAVLQSPHGQKFLDSVQKETGCLFTIDTRNRGIRIYGDILRQGEAEVQIKEFLENNKDRIRKEIELTGENKPAGLMKYLIVKHGVNLEKLLMSTQLDSVDLMLRRHALVMIGKEEAVSKAAEEITKAAEEVSKQPNMAVLGDECPVCLCPITGKIYHMEGCGHAYCYECIRQMFHSAATNKELPIKCAKDGCEELAYIIDIKQVIASKDEYQQLVSAAVDKFIADNKDRYRYCITPDCPVVYKSGGKARVFSCPLCFVKICRTCNNLAHEGLSCHTFNVLSGENEDLIAWLKEDEKNRCLCPKCDAAIEKNGGCNHMECTLCKIHFCWLCKNCFSSCGQTYAHLNSTHGGFA